MYLRGTVQPVYPRGILQPVYPRVARGYRTVSVPQGRRGVPYSQPTPRGTVQPMYPRVARGYRTASVPQGDEGGTVHNQSEVLRVCVLSWCEYDNLFSEEG